MIARLRKGQEALVESTMDHMKRFATEGLRTLMICQATITLEHFARYAFSPHPPNHFQL